MRAVFFGEDASTSWMRDDLKRTLKRYTHRSVDIRDREAIDAIFQHYGAEIKLVIHTAAQPSHDWAARDPRMDFAVNANGTLNLAGGYAASSARMRSSSLPRPIRSTETLRTVSLWWSCENALGD